MTENARSAHPRERTREPLIDPPRPAPPSCCHLPLLPHRYCHTALATWGTGPIVQHRQVLHPHHRTRRPRVDWLVREQTFGVDVRVFRNKVYAGYRRDVYTAPVEKAGFEAWVFR